MPDFAPKTRATTLLRHEQPDGGHHFDWLLARDPDGPLLTFRTDREISLDNEPFEAELLPDHRRTYLDYEGPISGGRGRVVRVAMGQCHIHTETDLVISVTLELGLRCGFWVGRRLSGRMYGFVEENDGTRSGL